MKYILLICQIELKLFLAISFHRLCQFLDENEQITSGQIINLSITLTTKQINVKYSILFFNNLIGCGVKEIVDYLINSN